MNLREAAEKALEALEKAISAVDGHYYDAVVPYADIAADNLRAALAAPSVPSVPVAYMMINKMHQLAPSLHFAPQEWHPSWEAVPLYTAPEAP